MSDEGKDDVVEKIVPDAEGKITPDKEGKYPEVVPWSKYVGIKESLGGKLDAERTKVTDLEEKLKNTTNAEEHTRVKEELETTKTKLQTASDELQGIKDKSLTEKKEALVKRGLAEDKVKDMSEEQVNTALGVLDVVKPKSDMGGGGGGASNLESKSPLALARMGYEQGGKSNK